MRSNHLHCPVRIGLLSDEPIRLAGLTTVFDLPSREGQDQLIPVTGTLDQLLGNLDLHYLVVDLSSSGSSLETLDAIRRARPGIRQIVIGPHGNEELIHEVIIGGARAYLEPTADPELVRKAIEEVAGGSIYASRRVLSRLVDRLLRASSEISPTASNPRLTGRERQVLDLILQARSNREIARHLGIEERTVKSHVSRLMRKTGSENRIELSMRTIGAAKCAAAVARHNGQTEAEP